MPAVQLRTARLRLRPVAPEDVAALHAIFIDPQVRRYLLDDQVMPRAWVAEEVEKSARAFEHAGWGLWSIARAEDPAPIGFTGFREFHEPPEVELLYGLHPGHWGQGLAAEAARAAMRYGFETLGFDPIRASIDVPNVASIRLIERLGFRETGRGPGPAYEQIHFELARGSFEPGPGRFEIAR